MKTFAKTFLVLFLTLGVLVGQTGIATAKDSSGKPLVCNKCACEREKPSCCVKQTDEAPVSQTPALPQLETRLGQPAIVFVSEWIAPARDLAGLETVARYNISFQSQSNIPLFLRHRAILI